MIIGGPIIEGPNDDAINYGSFSGSVQTIGSIVFAFQFTSAVFHCYNSLEDKSVETFSIVSTWSTSLGAVTGFTVGKYPIATTTTTTTTTTAAAATAATATSTTTTTTTTITNNNIATTRIQDASFSCLLIISRRW